MDFEAFHFAEPLWLLGLVTIPILWVAFSLFYRHDPLSRRFESLIDAHLLPYLLIAKKANQATPWKFRLISWSIIWGCLMLALAGPRWNYRDIEMVTKDQSLVILLDLSKSMDATDIKPSRLVRAKQKIEDLIQHSHGVKIGLIAFAADPHMIAPLTDDKETIRHLLPSLSTDLIYIQGSRLAPGLKMATTMLEAESNHHQSIVILSDGGFEDTSAIGDVKKLGEKGIAVHVIGMGTVEGAPVQDMKGNIIKKNGKAYLSKLERKTLQEISNSGQGFYIESNHDESAILNKLQSNSEAINSGKKMRLWDEGFFFFLLPALPLLLFLFRRGTLLSLATLMIPFFPLNAGITQDYFMNSEELGAEAFDREDYEEAAQVFQDPYRKGVSCYKAGHFEEAEKMFRQSTREEVARDAGYNLGNALAWQKKFQEAITAYEDVLKKWPDHQPTKENLELLKKLQEEQKPQDEKQENNPQDQEQSEKEDSNQPSSQEDPSESKEEDKAKDEEQESNQETKDEEEPSDEMPQEESEQKSQKDLDADVWLNRLSNDPKAFMTNKFYIESKKNGTREGIDPW